MILTVPETDIVCNFLVMFFTSFSLKFNFSRLVCKVHKEVRGELTARVSYNIALTCLSATQAACR